MRTKTLLLSAVALAAGLVSSFAQSPNVYSINIVGYVNLPATSGISLQSNPLDHSGNNLASTVFDNSLGQLDSCEIQQWNGAGYTISVFDSTSSTGFMNRLGTLEVPAPNLINGEGFYFNNLIGGTFNNTYVGVVRNTGTSSISLTNTVVLPPGLKLTAAPLPVAGNVEQLGLTNDSGVLNSCEIQVPNLGGGGILGFTISVYDDSSSTGFMNRLGTLEVPKPSLTVGQSAFFNNLLGAPVNWTLVVNVGP